MIANLLLLLCFTCPHPPWVWDRLLRRPASAEELQNFRWLEKLPDGSDRYVYVPE